MGLLFFSTAVVLTIPFSIKFWFRYENVKKAASSVMTLRYISNFCTYWLVYISWNINFCQFYMITIVMWDRAPQYFFFLMLNYFSIEQDGFFSAFDFTAFYYYAAAFQVTSGHSIFDVEIEKDIECKEHEDEVVRFYCEPCETCICVLCTFNEHKVSVTVF